MENSCVDQAYQALFPTNLLATPPNPQLFKELPLIQFKEEVLKRVDFATLSNNHANLVFDAMQGTYFYNLHIKNSKTLTTKILYNLVNECSETLVLLNVQGCQQLQDIQSIIHPGLFWKGLQQLENLDVSNTAITAIKLHHPYLKKLKAVDCKELKEMELLCPKLHKTRFDSLSSSY